MFETFITDRILKKEILFHDPFKKRKLVLFKASSKKVSLTRSTVVKTVEVNRDILGTLLALTAKTEKVINFENALENPLCSVPLSLACPDGTPRKTAKSKLLDVLRKRCRLPLTRPRENQPQMGSVAAFIIDLMANIRMITGIPETYEDLTWVFIKTIPTGYTRIDIVADTYPENSIKAAEHCRRGSSREIIIRSPQSKIPRDFRGCEICKFCILLYCVRKLLPLSRSKCGSMQFPPAIL